MDRAGLRLKLLAQQAAAGDLVLLFADESECLTHPYLAYVWAKRGEDLRVAAPGQAQRRALLGAFDAARHELIVVTSARKRSADLLLLLERLDQLYGPAPPTGGAGAGQRPDPHQQGDVEGAGGATVAHDRMAAQVCP